MRQTPNPGLDWIHRNQEVKVTDKEEQYKLKNSKEQVGQLQVPVRSLVLLWKHSLAQKSKVEETPKLGSRDKARVQEKETQMALHSNLALEKGREMERVHEVYPRDKKTN